MTMEIPKKSSPISSDLTTGEKRKQKGTSRKKENILGGISGKAINFLRHLEDFGEKDNATESSAQASIKQETTSYTWACLTASILCHVNSPW